MSGSELVGWPESLVRLMWPGAEGERLVGLLTEQRDYYLTHHCMTSVPAILGGMVQSWERAQMYPDDPAPPSAVPGQAMTSIDAALELYRTHRNGEAFAEGIPSGGGIPVTIPPAAWRGAFIQQGAGGYDLVQEATETALFNDVWLGATSPGDAPINAVTTARRGPGAGKKLERHRYQEYAAALAVIASDGDLDPDGAAAPIHDKVAQYLLDRGCSPFEVDRGRDIITLAQAWARGESVRR